MRSTIHCSHCDITKAVIHDEDTDPTGVSDICECGEDIGPLPASTFTVREVAIAVRYKLGLDIEAAESIIEEHITQIENLDERTIDRDDINEDDYDFLVATVSAARRSGDLGTRELENLSVTMRAIRAAELDRDPQIRAALQTGTRVKDLVDLTGLSRARIYQIKDAG